MTTVEVHKRTLLGVDPLMREKSNGGSSAPLHPQSGKSWSSHSATMPRRPSRTTLIEPSAQSEEELLGRFQRAAFSYFLEQFNPENGLVADRSPASAPASIAVVGFALSSYPVAVERGWVSRADATRRTLVTLRFFWSSEQSNRPDATGHKGFFYHFLDLASGRRVWQSELSPIDTALLMAGMLTAASYFDASTPEEIEIRVLAEALYRRVDWEWALGGEATVRQGWKPESGYLHSGWGG